MQNKNGKSIYNDKTLAKTLYNAKQYFQIGNIESFNKLVDYSCDIIKNAKDINSVLLFEAICLDVFDTNLINNNIDKISNKLIACNIAINENNLFEYNKETYLNNFLSSRIKDIKQDSAFEKSAKELIRYLGTEKRSILINEKVNDLIELRREKLRDICKEFTQKRQNFLSQHIKQEHTINKTLEKKKKSLER